MKIIHLGKFFFPYRGGIETVLKDVVEGFKGSKYKCDILCFNNLPTDKVETFEGFKVFRLKPIANIFSTPIGGVRAILKFKSIISQYDLIHFHHPNPFFTLALFFTLKNQKVVTHWHSDVVKQKGLLILFKPFQSWLLRKSCIIIGTSPNYINGSRHLNKFSFKTRVIPIGIDEKHVTDKKKLEELEKKYGEKKIVFALGRLVYYKGFSYLIDSASYLDDDIIILIGGEGRLKKSLQKRIAKKEIGDKVQLLGWLSDEEIACFYKLCHIFCLSSIEKSEAFGVVLIEAMSYSKPIVSTKIENSGVSWVNEDRVTGINVEPKNPKALANAIQTILRDEALSVKFSKNAYCTFKTKFTKEKMVQLFFELYQDIDAENI